MQKQVAAGKKWSKSSIAAENAKRKRNHLPILNDAEASALLGEPCGSARLRRLQRRLPPRPRPLLPRLAAAPAAACHREPLSHAPEFRLSYVGTPAVGTSKAAKGRRVAAIGPEDSPNQQRRRFVWAVVGAFLTAWFLAFFRFFLPRTLFEPATSFKIGYPEDYGLGVDTKWQQKYRIWVDNTPDRFFVIYARCTHLGCTPMEAGENKFKCPCHGIGIRQRRRELRRPGAAPDGSRAGRAFT